MYLKSARTVSLNCQTNKQNMGTIWGDRYVNYKFSEVNILKHHFVHLKYIQFFILKNLNNSHLGGKKGDFCLEEFGRKTEHF